MKRDQLFPISSNIISYQEASNGTVRCQAQNKQKEVSCHTMHSKTVKLLPQDVVKAKMLYKFKDRSLQNRNRQRIFKCVEVPPNSGSPQITNG